MTPYSSLLYDAPVLCSCFWPIAADMGSTGAGIIVLPRKFLVSKLVVKRDYEPGAKDLVVCDTICLPVLEGFSRVLILFVDALTSLLVGICCIDAAICLLGRGGTCPALLAPVGGFFSFATEVSF